MVPPNVQLEKIIDLIDQHERIAVISHFDPDGDAVGSVLAMRGFLNKLGKYPRVIIPNPVPAFLQWMPGFDDILIYEEQKEEVKAALKESTLILMLDFNDINRVKSMSKLLEHSDAKKILVDHHPDPVINADAVFSETEVSSTSEMVFILIEKAGKLDLVDKDIAESLFTGIITDTGCLSFNSSRPETYRILGKLLSYDVDKDKIISRVYENYSEERMQLLGYSLYEKMVVLKEYRTAYISLDIEELDEFSFQPGDTEGFVNVPFSIQGIVLTALFTEKPGYVKISFRSKGTFPINEFAKKHFSGGGHKNAAGGESKLSLDETIKKFVSLLEEYKDALLDVEK
ncbi:MAG: DHH family phosphoesterase [Bacteroidota bacterium]